MLITETAKTIVWLFSFFFFDVVDLINFLVGHVVYNHETMCVYINV